jgi:hypothetical protein
VQERKLRATMQLGVANAVVRRRKRHSCTIANICSLSDGKAALQTRVGNGICVSE